MMHGIKELCFHCFHRFRLYIFSISTDLQMDNIHEISADSQVSDNNLLPTSTVRLQVPEYVLVHEESSI